VGGPTQAVKGQGARSQGLDFHRRKTGSKDQVAARERKKKGTGTGKKWGEQKESLIKHHLKENETDQRKNWEGEGKKAKWSLGVKKGRTDTGARVTEDG